MHNDYPYCSHRLTSLNVHYLPDTGNASRQALTAATPGDAAILAMQLSRLSDVEKVTVDGDVYRDGKKWTPKQVTLMPEQIDLLIMLCNDYPTTGFGATTGEIHRQLVKAK